MSGSNSHEISPSHTPISSRNAPKFGTLVPNRVFVGGIHTDTTESELYDLFSTYGNVISTKIIADRAGVSKGYGFVTFETEEEARKIQNEESIVLKERKLNVAPAIKKQQPFPRMYGTDINSPDSCSSIEPSDSPLVRSANANDWSAINNVNPAEPLSNNGMYYNSGIPLTYPGVYNYVPSADPNQYPQQPYVWYSPVYIPHQQYPTQATPQVHWGGAAIRWPNQVGYEQPNSSPPTSSVPTSTTQSVHYAYSSAPSTPNSTVSNSGPKNNLVSSTNNAPSKNLNEKSGVYYALPPSAYTFQMPMQFAMAPPQGMGDNNETAGAESASVDLTPYNQGSYQKGGTRRQSSNFSPRKGPSTFLSNQNYNSSNNYRHYSPQRNYKPRYNDSNVPSHHYVDGKFTLGNHSGPLTPPATPMMTNKGATNGNDHVTDTAHRFKNLKLRD